MKLAVLIAALALAGAAQGAEFDKEVFRAFQPGTTTKAEVLVALGEPAGAQPSENGNSILLYEFEDAPVRETLVIDITAALLFDPEGRLLRVKFFDTPPEAPAAEEP